MRIGLKLTAAFLAIASLVGAAGYLSERTTNEVRVQIGRLKESAVPRLVGASQISVGLHTIQLAAHERMSAERHEAYRGTTLDVTRHLGWLEEPQKTVDQGLERLRLAVQSRRRWEATVGVSENRGGTGSSVEGSLASLQESWQSYQEILRGAMRLGEESPDLAERTIEEELYPYFDRRFMPLLVAQRKQAEQELTDAINGVERSLARAENQRGLLTLAAATSAILIGLVMSRSIGRPLARLKKAAQDVGRGRFETRVAIGGQDEIGVLSRALNQMVADLQERTVSRGYLENIIRSMHEMLIVADADAKIQLLNPAACCELGYDAGELIARPLRGLFDIEPPPASTDFPRTLGHGTESVMRSRKHGLIPVICSIGELHDETGRLVGFVCAASNNSRQKEIEQRLLDSLREKELLLQEVHHRVKNNLQVISSLLNLQAQQVRDPETIRLFQESQGRVRSLALIHEQLYRSRDLSQVDFAAYVRELVGHLVTGMGKMAAGVRFDFDLEPSPLAIDVAIPCGMMVNELVTNALEHAFPPGRSGTIRIVFRNHDGGYELTVADDGIGLAEKLLADHPDTLGWKVVQALTRQIRGRLDMQSTQGSTITIHFPVPRSGDVMPGDTGSRRRVPAGPDKE